MVFLGKNAFKYDISKVVEMVKRSKGRGEKGGWKVEMKGCD